MKPSLCQFLAKQLDWLQFPVTKYFLLIILFDISTKIKPNKYHDYKGWSLVTRLYSHDITLGFILVDY